jgi:hypothetical protein
MSPAHPTRLLALLLCATFCATGTRAGTAQHATQEAVLRVGAAKHYQGNIDDMIQFADILAGAQMSAADASALRGQPSQVSRR